MRDSAKRRSSRLGEPMCLFGGAVTWTPCHKYKLGVINFMSRVRNFRTENLVVVECSSIWLTQRSFRSLLPSTDLDYFSNWIFGFRVESVRNQTRIFSTWHGRPQAVKFDASRSHLLWNVSIFYADILVHVFHVLPVCSISILWGPWALQQQQGALPHTLPTKQKARLVW